MLVVAFLIGESGGGADPAPSASASATPGPLRTSVPDLDQAAAAVCDPVMQAMPVTLDDGAGSVLQPLIVTPGGPSFLAWGNPLVTLQCGVARPAPLTDSSGYVPYTFGPNNAPGATWLVEQGGDRDTWTVIDREVYFRATIPKADVGYLTDISAVIGSSLPAVCKGPVVPGDPPDTQYCGSRP